MLKVALLDTNHHSNLPILFSLITAVTLVFASSGIVLGQDPESAGSFTQRAGALASSTSLPTRTSLQFEENVGQLAPEARFQLRTSGATVFFADDALWVTVLDDSPDAASVSPARPLGDARLGTPSGNPANTIAQSPAGANVALRFVGANPQPEIEPFGPLPVQISYLIGNDPTRWHPDVPVWSGLRYANLYPGVDLEITGAQGAFAWRFVNHDGVTAGSLAVPTNAALRIEGADAVAVDGVSLQISTAVGAFRLPLFETDRTATTSQLGGLTATDTTTPPTVTSLGDGAGFGSFLVTSPWSSRSIAAEPQANFGQGLDLVYSTFLGGAGEIGDAGSALAVDSAGNIFVTGGSWSTAFPTTPGAFQHKPVGSIVSTAFVSRFDLGSDGAGDYTLAASTYYGGSDDNGAGGSIGIGIAVDASDDIYIVGSTTSTSIPTSSGAILSSPGCATPNCETGFLAELNPSFNALVYGTFFGGEAFTSINGVAVSGSNLAYLTGETQDTRFPVTSNAYLSKCPGPSGSCDVPFVSVVNPSIAGTAGLLYSTYLGGTNPSGFEVNVGKAIALDGSGDAYVTGETYATDFPITAGAAQATCVATSGGCDTAFVAEISPSAPTPAQSLRYSTYLGGSSFTTGNAIAVDATGNAYVTGETQATDFPTTRPALETTCPESNPTACDAPFLTKVAPSGASFIYSTYLGGSQSSTGAFPNMGLGVAVDGAGDAYVTGETRMTDFPTTLGALQTTCPVALSTSFICDSAFLAKVSPIGQSLLYSTYLGGSASTKAGGYTTTTGEAVAVDSGGDAYVTGATFATNYPITTNAYQSNNPSSYGSNVIVTKLNPNVSGIRPTTPSATPKFSPTSTGTATSTATTASTSTATSTSTVTPTSSSTATPTPSRTFTSTSTRTSEPTATPTLSPSATNTAIPTATDTPVPSDTPTFSPTASDTVTSTATPMPSSTPSSTAIPSDTPSSSPTPSNTPVPTGTDSPTPTVSPTATATMVPTATHSPAATSTATSSPSPTLVATQAPSLTPTATTIAPTLTSLPTATPTSTVTGGQPLDVSTVVAGAQVRLTLPNGPESIASISISAPTSPPPITGVDPRFHPILAIQLLATDASGNPISQVATPFTIDMTFAPAPASNQALAQLYTLASDGSSERLSAVVTTNADGTVTVSTQAVTLTSFVVFAPELETPVPQAYLPITFGRAGLESGP